MLPLAGEHITVLDWLDFQIPVTMQTKFKSKKDTNRRTKQEERQSEASATRCTFSSMT